MGCQSEEVEGPVLARVLGVTGLPEGAVDAIVVADKLSLLFRRYEVREMPSQAARACEMPAHLEDSLVWFRAIQESVTS